MLFEFLCESNQRHEVALGIQFNLISCAHSIFLLVFITVLAECALTLPTARKVEQNVSLSFIRDTRMFAPAHAHILLLQLHENLLEDKD